MTFGFISSKAVIGRKEHRCEHCGRAIVLRERHQVTAQLLDDVFSQFREHMECRAAWLDWNQNLRDDAHNDDGWPFLNDDDDLDREWIEFAHPVVAERLWPVRLVKGERQ